LESGSNSDWDYGYTDGVEFDGSDSDYEPETDSDLDSDSNWSDNESLAEYEGDELEENLHQRQELIEEILALEVPTKYDQIATQKSVKEWAKAEENQALGYLGHSKHTQHR
jgi:hypothetical protein